MACFVGLACCDWAVVSFEHCDWSVVGLGSSHLEPTVTEDCYDEEEYHCSQNASGYHYSSSCHPTSSPSNPAGPESQQSHRVTVQFTKWSHSTVTTQSHSTESQHRITESQYKPQHRITKSQNRVTKWNRSTEKSADKGSVAPLFCKLSLKLGHKVGRAFSFMF